jgi:hypothetical protein
VTLDFISITNGGMLIPSPGGLSSAHTSGTLKGISVPFKGVSTECNLHSSSQGVTRARTVGGPEPELKAAYLSS